MYKSFNGQYNDNPKYICEAIHKIDPTIKMVWVIGDRCHEKAYIPAYIKTVKMYSMGYAIQKAKSKALVENAVGWYFWEKKHRISMQLIKKKNQYNLSTWHGSSLKTFG